MELNRPCVETSNQRNVSLGESGCDTDLTRWPASVGNGPFEPLGEVRRRQLLERMYARLQSEEPLARRPVERVKNL